MQLPSPPGCEAADPPQTVAGAPVPHAGGRRSSCRSPAQWWREPDKLPAGWPDDAQNPRPRCRYPRLIQHWHKQWYNEVKKTKKQTNMVNGYNCINLTYLKWTAHLSMTPQKIDSQIHVIHPRKEVSEICLFDQGKSRSPLLELPIYSRIETCEKVLVPFQVSFILDILLHINI